MRHRNVSTLTNIISFQFGWFSCVLAAARGWTLVGPSIVLLLSTLHLWRTGWRRSELRLLALVGIFGFAVDTFCIAVGLYRPAHTLMPLPLCPFWLVALWVNFATTLNHSLGWLQNRTCLSGLLGAAGGPLAYWGAQRLGGIQVDETAMALICLSIIWALSVPVTVRMAKYFSLS